MGSPKITKTKKVISTLLTFWIPIKKYRRKYRGIFTIGLFKYFKIVKYDKAHNFPVSLAIGAIMKDEGPYLKEWLDFHILVGVDKFYLYDNGSTDNTTDILQPYIDSGVVEYTYYPGNFRQQSAYLDIIEKHSGDTRWLALIDLDEFIVPVQHKTIPEFLYTLPLNFAQLVIAWIIYGSSGHKTKPDGLVIENFKYHAKNSWGIKSIINPRLITTITNPHANLVAGSTIDENGKWLGKINQSNSPVSSNFIRCNHYITKSMEECIARKTRALGWGGEKNVETATEFFNNNDRNDVYDNIMNRFVKKLKNEK